MYKDNWTQPWPMGSEIYPEVHENPRAFFNSSSPIFLVPLAHGSSDWSLPREDCIRICHQAHICNFFFTRKVEGYGCIVFPSYVGIFLFSIFLSFLFRKLFSKVDRIYKFDVTLLPIFEACEYVVVTFYLLLRFRKYFAFGSFEKFSKLLHHKANSLHLHPH